MTDRLIHQGIGKLATDLLLESGQLVLGELRLVALGTIALIKSPANIKEKILEQPYTFAQLLPGGLEQGCRVLRGFCLFVSKGSPVQMNQGCLTPRQERIGIVFICGQQLLNHTQRTVPVTGLFCWRAVFCPRNIGARERNGECCALQ